MANPKDNQPGLYVRSVGWRYPEPITPMPAPYAWRRMVLACVFAALCIGLGAVIVAF